MQILPIGIVSNTHASTVCPISAAVDWPPLAHKPSKCIRAEDRVSAHWATRFMAALCACSSAPQCGSCHVGAAEDPPLREGGEPDGEPRALDLHAG